MTDVWEVTNVSPDNKYLDELLSDGWEPFAVAPESNFHGAVSLVWLRRQKTKEV